MRIFFIGTVKFSYDALNALIQSGAQIVGVATKETSSFNADYADLKPLCDLNSISLKQVKDINHPNNINFIKSTIPDIIYCFGWSSLLKEEILSIPEKGIIGFHPAKLPNNRGRHPIVWALCLGLNSTGSTFFFMDNGADTGDIISQEEIIILEQDTAQSLYEKITETAINQILIFTKQLSEGTNKRVKQTELGNSWRKRGKADGLIDFRMTSKAIYNLVRALTRPYIGAHLNHEGNDCKVWSVEISQLGNSNDEPGKVLKIRDACFIVKTFDNSILIKEHELNKIPNVGEYL